EEIKGAGLLAGRNETPHYKWDYGSFVPLQYLDPAQRIPVVTIGTCVLADLDECYRVGTAVRMAAEKSGKRVVFVASSALSHTLPVIGGRAHQFRHPRAIARPLTPFAALVGNFRRRAPDECAAPRRRRTASSSARPCHRASRRA